VEPPLLFAGVPAKERRAGGRATLEKAEPAGIWPPESAAHATLFEKRVDFARSWTGRFMRVLDERLDEKTRRDLMLGYVAYLFERNLGRPVRVELLESLRGGGKACRFAVHARCPAARTGTTRRSPRSFGRGRTR
jgi:hypothetical protein